MKQLMILIIVALTSLFIPFHVVRAQVTGASPSTLSWENNETTTKYIIIYCNGGWQLDTASVSGNSHFVVSAYYGYGNSTISVTPKTTNSGSEDIPDYLGIEGLSGGFAGVTLTHKADPNYSGGSGTPFLSLSTNTLEWTYNDTSAKCVTVTTNGSMWRLASVTNSPYYNVSPDQGASGSAVWISPKNPNNTYSSITRGLTFETLYSGASEELIIIQQGKPHSVMVDESIITWSAGEVSGKQIDITATGDWTASVSGTWFSLNNSAGTEGGSIIVTPSSLNYGDFPRYGNITLNCHGATTTISLIQEVSDQPLGIVGNWTMERTYLRSSEANHYDDITFYDGLGYAEQVVQVGASTSGYNIVTPIWYDAVRRTDVKTYLPFVSNNTTAIKMSKSSAITAQSAYYQEENGFAYAYKNYEKSALDRPLWSRKPGKSYNDSTKIIIYGHDTNSQGEVFSLSVNRGDSLIVSGYYACGALYKESVTDEAGSTQVEYTDKDGRKVLCRVFVGNQNLDTYYAYDSYGHLAWVISPEGSALLGVGTIWSCPTESDHNCSSAAKYCYVYHNNSFGWQLKRKLPGKEIEYLHYDNAGRVIRSQDGALRAENKWFVHGYDNLGREIANGLSSSSAAGQGIIQTVLIQTKYGTYTGIGSELAYETTDNLPGQISVNLAMIKGLKTYEKIAILGDNGIDDVEGYMHRAFYYDACGRVCQTVEKYPDGHLCRTSFLYDLTGKVLASLEAHSDVGGDPHYLKTLFSYDKRGRTKSMERIVDGETMTPVYYAYDDFGRLSCTTLGDSMSNNAIGRQDYQYDLRGWMQEGFSRLNMNQLFVESLQYDWDGNIKSSGISRKDVYGTLEGYSHSYAYDEVKRLTAATYKNNAGMSALINTENGITYDRNGNILTICRYGPNGLDDTLNYTYSGNVLSQINNQSYCSDQNGNMTYDGKTGLQFEYNLLNLPQKVSSQPMNTSVSYRYLADGTKESAIDNMGYGLKYRGSFVYDQNNTPESVAWLEGRIKFSPAIDSLAVVEDSLAIEDPVEEMPVVDSLESDPIYRFIDEWHVKDHLGSIRAVIVMNGVYSSDDDRIIEVNDYLPFGTRIPVISRSDNRFHFGGKENMSIAGTDIGLLDFGARYYNPYTTRWTTMDPLAEKYVGWSPYNYCAGNPVNLVDPKGLSWYYSNVDGSFVSHIDDKDDKIYLISQKQIDAANGDEKTLQSYRSDNNTFGLLALEKELDMNVAKGVISDLFDRANKKTEGGEETYVAKPEINITHDFSGDEASSTTKVLNVNLGRSGFFNGYDAINLLSHEIGHILHRKRVGEKPFSMLSKDKIELEADTFSIKHWSYEKTSDTRKKKIMNHMAHYNNK